MSALATASPWSFCDANNRAACAERFAPFPDRVEYAPINSERVRFHGCSITSFEVHGCHLDAHNHRAFVSQFMSGVLKALYISEGDLDSCKCAAIGGVEGQEPPVFAIARHVRHGRFDDAASALRALHALVYACVHLSLAHDIPNNSPPTKVLLYTHELRDWAFSMTDEVFKLQDVDASDEWVLFIDECEMEKFVDERTWARYVPDEWPPHRKESLNFNGERVFNCGAALARLVHRFDALLNVDVKRGTGITVIN